MCGVKTKIKSLHFLDTAEEIMQEIGRSFKITNKLITKQLLFMTFPANLIFFIDITLKMSIFNPSKINIYNFKDCINFHYFFRPVNHNFKIHFKVHLMETQTWAPCSYEPDWRKSPPRF